MKPGMIEEMILTFDQLYKSLVQQVQSGDLLMRKPDQIEL